MAGAEYEIHRHHVCITGFLQSHASSNAGLVDVWRRLDIEHGRDPQTLVSLRSWKDNWDDFAELFFRFRNGTDPDIRVYAYSWGAGFGAIQFAKALQSRGLKIRSMVLSDPVYFSRLISTRWLAMIQEVPFLKWSPRIVVPSNVERVTYFRQSKNRPAGHELIAEDSEKTKIEPAQFLSYDHQHMDDSFEFRSECLISSRKDF